MSDLSALREDIARMIAPSSWRVMDGYLALVKRKPNAGYDPDNFKDRMSLALADQILRRVEGYLEPSCPGCGACPGFTGADCDETCDWATTPGKGALTEEEQRAWQETREGMNK